MNGSADAPSLVPDDAAPPVVAALPAREQGGAPPDDVDYLLLCHDDVAIDPADVQALLDVARSTGAGVVGPKLVDADDLHRLVAMGYAVTKGGAVAPLVEPDELDQGQHDGTRDVFAVPGDCLLVRADLLRAVGFDPALPASSPAAAVSLCWRARVAGAGVVVTSDAVAAVPRTGGRFVLPREGVRLVLSCYGRGCRWRVVPQVLGAQAVDSARGLVKGRLGAAAEPAGAWARNLWRWRSLRAVRRQVRQARRTPDRTVRRRQVAGVLHARVGARRDLAGGTALSVPRPLAAWAHRLRSRWTNEGALVMLVLAAVLAVGSRHLVTRGVPEVGDLLPLGTGSGLLRLVLTVGLVPLGIAGALLAARSATAGSPRAPMAAAVAYAALPMPYAALAAGRWAPLALYAAAPWWLNWLVGSGSAAGHRIVGLGIVTAAVAAVVPSAPVLLAGTGLALAAGALLAFRPREVVPPLVAGVGGAVVAVALHLPWALEPSSTASPWSALQRLTEGDGPGAAAAVSLEPVDLLGFGVGRPEVLPWLWALPLAAAIPLFVGRGDRLTGAIRAWTLALVAWTAAMVAGRVGVAAPLPDVDLLLVLAGAGVAAAVGLGAAAIETDLAAPRRKVRRRDRRRWRPPTRVRRVGRRSITAGVAVVAVTLAAVPLLRSALDGYWGMPRGDFAGVLGFVGDDVALSGGNILWLGDTRVVPLHQDAGVRAADTGRGMGPRRDPGDDAGSAPQDALAVTDRLPRLADRWQPAPAALVRRARDSVEAGTAESTHRLGGALAPLGVEYVVVPQGLAPAPFGPPEAPTPRVVGALDGQFDLVRVDVDPSVVVYRNLAFASDRQDDPPDPTAAQPPQTFPDPASRRTPAPGQALDAEPPGEPSPWKLRLGMTAWGGVLLFLLVHQRRRAAAADGLDAP